MNKLLMVPLLLSLGACSTDMTDLESYVEQAKTRFQGSVEPLPQFPPYQTYAYRSERDPFAPLDTLERKEEVRESGVAAPQNRPLEPLEYFPLDALAMVGTLDRGGHRWGLIKDTDGRIHRVHAGNHIGQDYGTITEISATAVSIVELAQDENGLWVERESQLHIGE